MSGSCMTAEITPLRAVWLAAAVLGAGETLWRGFAPPDAVAAGVLVLWCLIETMVRRNWAALLTLPALAFGLGCALPLYLFFRSAKVV